MSHTKIPIKKGISIICVKIALIKQFTLGVVISNFNHIIKYIHRYKSGLTDIGWHVLITYMISYA